MLLSFLLSTAHAAGGGGQAGLSNNSPLASAVAAGSSDTVAYLITNRLAEIILINAVPMAIFGLLAAAWYLTTSSGNPEAYKKLKQILMSIFIGFLFIAGAAGIVKLLTSMFKS